MLRASAASVVSSAATLGVQVAAFPLLLSGLGERGFSSFQVCLSIFPWFALSTFGLDKALKNALLKATDEQAMELRARVAGTLLRRVAISTVLLLVTAPWLVSVVFGSAGEALSWPRLFVVFATMAAANAALLIGREVLYAQGRGVVACHFQTGIMLLVGAGLIVVRLAGAALTDQARTTAALLVWLVPQLAGGVVQCAIAGVVPRSLSDVWRPAPIVGAANWMMATTVLGLMASNLDFVVLSHLADSRTVVEYALASKIVAVHALFFSGYLSFAWIDWGRQMHAAPGRLPRGLGSALALGAGSAAVTAIFASWLLSPLSRWLGLLDASFSSSTYAALGVALVARSAGDTLVTLSLARERPQSYLRAVAVQALVTVSLEVGAAAWGLGIAGMLGAAAVGSLLLTFVLALDLSRAK